jgi:predicted permease
MEPEGYVPAPGESLEMNRAGVSPGYFETVRLPILSGRDFTTQDVEHPPVLMIVNETFARRYFQGQNPVGRKIRMYDRVYTVVGLARDSKYFTPVETARPFVYLPMYNPRLRELHLFVRTVQEPTSAIPIVRRVIRATDPNVAVHALPLAEYTQVALLPQKVAASLVGALGVMCLLLAALGLYSLMSYAVSQRTQEIGIRMAMGAQPANVVRMVVRQGMSLAVAGLAAGLIAALAVTRFFAGMLVNLSCYDGLTFGGVAVFLTAVTLAATWLPAFRATRINPMMALRRQ